MANDPQVLVTMDGHEYPNPFMSGVCKACHKHDTRISRKTGMCFRYVCIRDNQ